MQGVAGYYKALAMEARNARPRDIIGVYKNALEKICCAGHQIYLAQVGLSMARIMRQSGRGKEALETGGDPQPRPPS